MLQSCWTLIFSAKQLSVFKLSQVMPLSMIAVDWSISGYHVFRVRPHKDIRMFIQLEPENRYGRYAVKVIMPRLEYIAANLLDEETRDGQKVRDIAGRVVGRVPRCSCTAFSKLIEHNLCGIGNFRVTCQGHVDVTQAGPELGCTYLLSVPSERFREAMSIFETYLSRQDLERISCW